MSAIAVRTTGMPKFWTPERIFDAMRAWVDEHGQAPSTVDWMGGGYGRPSALTVYRTFDWISFDGVVELAGLEPRRLTPGAQEARWNRQTIIDAMLDWVARHNRWPSCADWNKSAPDHPCALWVCHHFGTWNAARRAAGWEATCPVCEKRFDPFRRSQIFCSNQCKQTGLRRRKRGVPLATAPVSTCCTGCGCELGNQTIGCDHCHDRKRRRAQRAAAKSGARSPGSQASPRADGSSAPGVTTSFTETDATASRRKAA